MNKYIFFIFKLVIAIVLFTSCKDSRESYKSIDIIDLSNTFNKKQKTNLSIIVSKVEYIQLQGDSTAHLGQIYRPKRNIKFFGDKILVSDANGKLLLFNTQGKFLNQIGIVGRGPEEYVKPDNFTFVKNNKDTLAAVFSSAQQKTLLYTLSGDFIKALPIDFWPIGLTSINNNLIFINSIGKRRASDYYTLSVVSSSGSLKKRLLYKKDEKKIELNKELGLSAMYNDYSINGSLSFWEKDYDTIWRITNELNLTPKYFIDIGGNKMPFEEQTMANIVDLKKRNKYNAIIEVQETSRFLFIGSNFKARLHRIYYDKISKEGTCVEFKKEFGRGINFAFYNDIDGGMPFWPVGQVSDDKMYKLMYGYELKEYLNKQGDNFETMDKKARQRLLKLAENAKISDNPILMIVTLKK